MRAIQHEGGLRKSELKAIAAGQTAVDIDDMEFLETLAQYRCMVMPPWVFHIRPDGSLPNGSRPFAISMITTWTRLPSRRLLMEKLPAKCINGFLPAH